MGVLIPLGLLAGCGGGGDFIGVNAENMLTDANAVKLARRPKKTVPPPQIQKPVINPTSLGSSGGTVHIQAKVKSKKKKFLTVNSLIARENDFQMFTVPLSRVRGKKYGGDFNAPANPGSQLQTYIVDVEATNSRATPNTPVTARAGSFSVEGSPTGPPPPSGPPPPPVFD